MRQQRFWSGGAVVLLLALASGAAAQTAANEQSKLLAKRAAEADAYRKLAQAVYGLQINGQTTVRDFVTESDEIRGAVDQFIRGIRLGDPIWQPDGSCEVPAEVTVSKVVETLRNAHDRYYKGSKIKTGDYESITRRIDKQVLQVVGVSVMPTDPVMPPVSAGQPAAPPSRQPIPEIWRQLPAQARYMTLQAARMDAQRRLAERIKGLRLTSQTQVRDFMVESDTITTELNAYLVGAREVRQALHPDELIAEVTLVVPTEQVITAIKELHSRYYKGDDVRGSDIEQAVNNVVNKEFEATGMGIPPPRFLQKYVEATPAQEPDWIVRNLEAEGRGTDPEMGTPQGKLRAARAAELDARRRLGQQVGGLKISTDTTVDDFASRHNEIVAVVDAFIGEALVSNTRFENNTAVVVVTIPGLRVWSALNSEIHRLGLKSGGG